MPFTKAVENLAKKKISGGRRIPYRGRRAFEQDRYSSEPTIGTDIIAKRKVRGKNQKIILRKVSYANVFDHNNKRVVKTKILKVVKNPANRDYERRGVISKGAIIETEIGNAKVTSRPGQHGIVNAITIK